MDYYSLLGYSEEKSKILIREHSEKYSEITGDQLDYLTLARKLVNEVIVSVPEIDQSKIKQRAIKMAEYDPYAIRRKRNQEVAGTGAVLLGSYLTSAPELVIIAAALALSQIELENEDNALEFLEKKFEANGVDNQSFQTILDGRKNIIVNGNLSE